jgi:arsenate reductase
MAHGYLDYFGNEKANVYSAGIETHGLNPKAVLVMSEDGVDISAHTSNHVGEYANIDFDFIITVCDHAKENCPMLLSNAMKIHFNFPDPAKAKGSAEEIFNEFRKVRGLIRGFCKQFVLETLKD